MWTSNIDDILTYQKLPNVAKYKALRLRLWKSVVVLGKNKTLFETWK